MTLAPNPHQRAADEAVLRPASLFAGAAHCPARIEPALRADPRRQPQQAHRQRRRLPRDQPQGLRRRPATGQRRGADRRPGDPAVSGGSATAIGAGSSTWQFRPAASAGMVEFHLERDSRRTRRAVRRAPAGRGDQGKVVQAFCRAGDGAGAARLSAAERLQRGRCVAVCGAALGRVVWHRTGTVAGVGAVSSAD